MAPKVLAFAPSATTPRDEGARGLRHKQSSDDSGSRSPVLAESSASLSMKRPFALESMLTTTFKRDDSDVDEKRRAREVR